MYGRERYQVIDEEISLCGYFVIITSEKMTAADALDLYKSRDASEKLFREFNKERKINAYLKKLKALGWEPPVVAT